MYSWMRQSSPQGSPRWGVVRHLAQILVLSIGRSSIFFSVSPDCADNFGLEFRMFCAHLVTLSETLKHPITGSAYTRLTLSCRVEVSHLVPPGVSSRRRRRIRASTSWYSVYPALP